VIGKYVKLIVITVGGLILVALLIAALVKYSLDGADAQGTTENTADIKTGAIVELSLQNGKIVGNPVASFNSFVSATGLPVFVAFWSASSASGSQSAPIVRTLAREYSGKALFLYIDIDRSKGLAIQQNIQSTPLFVIFKDGLRMGSVTDYNESKQSDLRSMIDSQIG
jgi:thiol-disulfide isomerase/thioredoxin